MVVLSLGEDAVPHARAASPALNAGSGGPKEGLNRKKWGYDGL